MLNRWIGDPPTPTEQLLHALRLLKADDCVAHGAAALVTLKMGHDGEPELPGAFIRVGSNVGEVPGTVDAPMPTLEGFLAEERLVVPGPKCADPVGPDGGPNRSEPDRSLIHAAIPAVAVIQSAPDAILALTASGHEMVERCFGHSVSCLPYGDDARALAKAVVRLFERGDACDALVIMHVGLISWGHSVKEAYERHTQALAVAESFVGRPERSRIGGWNSRALPREFGASADTGEKRTAGELAPTLRGLLSAERSVVLEFDNSDEVLAFVNDDFCAQASQISAPSFDVVSFTGDVPLFLSSTDQIRSSILAYKARHTPSSKHDEAFDTNPRVILVRGLGMFTCGTSATMARAARDMYRHTIHIIGAAQRVGRYRGFPEAKKLDGCVRSSIQYASRDDSKLAGKVALVTAVGSQLGSRVAWSLAEHGAHVVVTDEDEDVAGEMAAEIVRKHGLRRAVAVRIAPQDPRSISAALAYICRTFGGADIVFSIASAASTVNHSTLSLSEWDKAFEAVRMHFLLARSAFTLMREQGVGGSLAFVTLPPAVSKPDMQIGYRVAKGAEAELNRIFESEGQPFGIRCRVFDIDSADSAFGSAIDAVALRFAIDRPDV